MLLLGLGGCDRVRRLVGLTPKAPASAQAAAAADGGAGEHGEQAAQAGHAGDGGAAPGAHASAEEPGHGPDGGPGRGPGDEDVEAEYTPRRLSIDEEDCDDVTREALGHLRQQAEALTAAKKAVVEREGAVKARELAHARAAAQLEERIKELGRLKAEIEQRIAQRSPAVDPARIAAERARRGERVKEVARMVSGMTAQRAATLLGEFQDDELAVEVLQGLPQEVAGKVLGQMRPTSAARLAERLGGGDRGGDKGGDKEGARP